MPSLNEPMRTCPKLSIVLLFTAPLALADNSNSNRQIIPIGETEAFMGNTGTGRADDTGAVYYNPAGLADMTSGRVSVTSSVYVNFNTRSDAIIYFDQTNVGYQASGFNTIPGFYVASTRWEEWYGAISILVPSSIQVENHAPFFTPNTSGNIVQSQRSSDLWMGLSLARKLDSRWSLGVTLFGVQHQEATSLGVDIQYPAAATTAVTSSLSQINLNVLGLSAVFGVSFAATDWLKFGLRAQTALVQLAGSADTFKTTHQTTAGKVTTSNENLPGTSANYRLPFDFTFGTALTPVDWFAFLADISLQLGADYNSIPDSSMGDPVNLTPTPRFNLGMELKPARWLPVRFGFYYNPSAAGGTAGTEGHVQEDYMGLTGGIGVRSTRVETGIGAFYIWSNGLTTPIGAPNTTARLTSHGVGGLLTASYFL